MMPLNAKATLRTPEIIAADLAAAERRFVVQYGSKGYHQELLAILEEFAAKGIKSENTDGVRKFPKLNPHEPYTAKNRTDDLDSLVREYVAKKG